ncbi:hypothetical protein O181_051091, partial [Austropuccinia psidii MF-1]|nr:hypothetical protein [Austropuccinia psidii MF-1]
MSPVHLRNVGIPRNQPDNREGFPRARRPGGGPLDAVKPQTRGLEGYELNSSAPLTPRRSFQWIMHNKRFNLASHWEELG